MVTGFRRIYLEEWLKKASFFLFSKRIYEVSFIVIQISYERQDIFSHLHKKLCPSVRPSSVHPTVGRSVYLTSDMKKMKRRISEAPFFTHTHQAAKTKEIAF